MDLILGLGRSLGEGNGNPLQYSCLGNPMDRGAWWATVPGVYLQSRRPGLDSWVRKIPWRREWQPTPVFLPGEFHGLRSLVGYSPWGYKESDTNKWLTLIIIWGNHITSDNSTQALLTLSMLYACISLCLWLSCSCWLEIWMQASDHFMISSRAMLFENARCAAR